ncbi:MAG: ceramidase [Clostridia bacterium]|nr:ceramidase [Deltaproteobacteria bacterium]
MDWCEANYAVSPYIAEWWNTLSSVAMVFAGFAGAWRERQRGRTRFAAAFALLVIVGLGSVAFHGTLRFELQMLDELPMVYLVLLIVWISSGVSHRYGQPAAIGFVAYGIVLTLLVTLARGSVQFVLFQVGFGTLEIYAIARTWWLQRQASPKIQRHFRFGMTLYVIAVIAWITDTSQCYTIIRWSSSAGLPNPQLHAIWHVLVSLGFYALLSVIADVTTVNRGAAKT